MIIINFYRRNVPIVMGSITFGCNRQKQQLDNVLTEQKQKHKHKKNAYAHAYVAAVLTGAKASKYA